MRWRKKGRCEGVNGSGDEAQQARIVGLRLKVEMIWLMIPKPGRIMM